MDFVLFGWSHGSDLHLFTVFMLRLMDSYLLDRYEFGIYIIIQVSAITKEAKCQTVAQVKGKMGTTHQTILSFKVSTWKDGMKCMTKINRNRHTHAYSVWWTPQTAALVWWSGNNDGVMETTLGSMEVAASASIIAGEVGVITGFCCGSVYSVSLCIPQHEDRGIVALSNRCDTREGAGSWGNRQISFTDTAECMHLCFTQGWALFQIEMHISFNKSEMCYLSAGRSWRLADSHICCF